MEVLMACGEHASANRDRLCLSGHQLDRVAQATRPSRVSADHVPFPEAGKRVIDLPLPGIAAKIGALPEEAVPQLLNAERAAHCWRSGQRRLTRPQWFSVSAPEADAIGLRLTDARVSEIQLAFNRVPDHRLASLRERLKAMGAQPTPARRGSFSRAFPSISTLTRAILQLR